MSVVLASSPSLPSSLSIPIPPSPTTSRKRTSFCCSNLDLSLPSPKTLKTEMGQLRRSETFVCLPELESKASTSSLSCKRSLRCHKEQREKRKALLQRAAEAGTPALQQSSTPFTTPSSPSPSLPPQRKQYPAAASAQPACRVTSPLSPVRAVLPARPTFPRSKHEPDLYRQAIIARMRCTPEGQKILHMGPRLALSIMNATKELERIVAAQAQVGQERDGDTVMADATSCSSVDSNSNSPNPPAPSHSWVIVPGEDWEMIDCGA